MVFSSVYPVESENFEELNKSINKLLLNDASVIVEKETSIALGTGLRCGFLGLLHMEIFFERLEKEYDTEVIITAPSIPYSVELKNHEIITIEKASDLPQKDQVLNYFEPMIHSDIISPMVYLKDLQYLLSTKRGILNDINYMDGDIVSLQYDLPWAEMVNGLYNELIRITSGYATIDYKPIEARKQDIQRVDILINHQPVDALSFICAKEVKEKMGRLLVERLAV